MEETGRLSRCTTLLQGALLHLRRDACCPPRHTPRSRSSRYFCADCFLSPPPLPHTRARARRGAAFVPDILRARGPSRFKGMGAHHSVSDFPVQVSIVIPSRGGKANGKHKFIRQKPPEGTTVSEFYEKYLREAASLDPKAYGGLLCATAVVRGCDDEVEVDRLSDDVSLYLQLGLVKAFFYVEQGSGEEGGGSSAGPEVRVQERSVSDVLVRQLNLELPEWTNAARPAHTVVFNKLRAMFAAEKLGFSGSADKRIGEDWMKGLTDVLYKLSPFHAKLKARKHPIPEVFAFSEGADDYKKKGRAAPQLTQELLQQVSCIRLPSGFIVCCAHCAYTLPSFSIMRYCRLLAKCKASRFARISTMKSGASGSWP